MDCEYVCQFLDLYQFGDEWMNLLFNSSNCVITGNCYKTLNVMIKTSCEFGKFKNCTDCKKLANSLQIACKKARPRPYMSLHAVTSA